MKLESYQTGKIFVIEIEAEAVDAKTSEMFQEQILKRINPGLKKIVLDFENVEFIDSSGLGALVSILKHVRHHSEIRLCNLNSSIMTVFKITRLDKIFRIYDSRAEVINSFQSQEYETA